MHIAGGFAVSLSNKRGHSHYTKGPPLPLSSWYDLKVWPLGHLSSIQDQTKWKIVKMKISSLMHH